jgi:hypothetical protein
VPFTTRDTVAVETPALFATSLMFMRCASRRVNERIGPTRLLPLTLKLSLGMAIYFLVFMIHRGFRIVRWPG